jgi:DNA-binding response OmpR family regulator
MDSDPSPIVVAVPDLLMRQRLVGGLEAAGFTAKGAATLARLTRALDETRPAAVLVELDGVGIDGVALVAELKGDERTAGVPVIGFCAHTRTELIEGAREAGADRVVSRGELTNRLVRIATEVTGEPPAS